MAMEAWTHGKIGVLDKRTNKGWKKSRESPGLVFLICPNPRSLTRYLSKGRFELDRQVGM